MLGGLNWSAVGDRLSDMDSDRRERMRDLLASIEAGALKAAADRRAEAGED